MKIVIDTTPLTNANAMRGVGRYTGELVEALQRVKGENDIFSSGQLAVGQKVDLVHYPFFDLFFPTLPLRRSARTVVTVHDVIPLLFPAHYPVGVRGRLAFWRQKLALSTVSKIITDSVVSRRDIHTHLGVPLEKIVAVPLAASPDFFKPAREFCIDVKRKYELPKIFILYVGDINYNKNLPFLLRVTAKIPKLHLVMVGKQMKNTSIPEGRTIQNAIATLAISDRVKLLTDVENGDLPAIYALSTATIIPSLYEGFGLPALEAMQCKTVVISSCGGSLPEVVGDGGLMFNPHDDDECEQKIREVLKFSPEMRNALIRKGTAQAAKFSWEATAKQTLVVYQSCLQN
ncbi:MAG TPA: glycosyltransferase family 1 protein [Patescibacteria group bacterium]|nr:glycosyltransferase family 1 protein [Patescibacteria group bacterium]